MTSVSGLPIQFGSPLAGLAVLRDAASRRSSSWDRSGGNDDRFHLGPGDEAVLLDARGPGCIRHVWMTLGSDEPDALRKVVLRAWWDDEPEPSVNVPIGDFFGVGHGLTTNFASLPLQMSPQDGRGFACWFPMPFASSARITARSECSDAEVNSTSTSTGSSTTPCPRASGGSTPNGGGR